MKASSIFLSTIISLNIFGCTTGSRIIETVSPPLSDSQTSETVLSATEIVTFTPEIIGTQVPIPKENPTQALFMIEKLLSQNDFCPTPCLWGVVPNETTFEEAQTIFTYLGDPLTQTLQLDNQSFYESSYGPRNGLRNGISFQVILRVQDAYVKNISAYIVPPDTNSSSANNEEWKAYTIQYVLQRYGVPSRVEFAYPVGPNLSRPEIIDYFTRIYFDSLHLIFEYESSIKYDYGAKRENFFTVCPLIDKVLSVHIWLGEQPNNPPAAGFPLEKISLLSLKDFYDTLVERNGCIDLDQRILFPWN